ncbi:Uncharacterised protein [Streptococcus uberis]|uniref:hypothetical protein n=1 Tax=Streptococcus uberis TaxID=1349 RepID=UPI000DA29F9B|nr:hypothetical protein [Streptococcus uberis]SQG83689.1 Uncharacterised protein [Streptococcus uberis]
MGTIILIIFSTFLSAIVFGIEKYKNSKMVFENIVKLHSQERYTIEYKSSLIKDEYPILSMVATSMTYTSKKYNSEEILGHIKTVDGKLRLELKKEIKSILKSDNENAKEVLRWYMIACKLVEYAERDKKIEISLSEESRKISKNEYDQRDYDNTFCMA